MAASPILTLACLSCNMLFKKDLSIFGDQDEVCPHCGNRYIKEGETNEGVLFNQGMDEIVDMLDFAMGTEKGIKSTSDMALIGTLAEDEESVTSNMSNGDQGRAAAMEERKNKLMKLKKRKKSKAKAKGADEGKEGGGGGIIPPPVIPPPSS